MYEKDDFSVRDTGGSEAGREKIRVCKESTTKLQQTGGR